jgi:hypothetical protein
MSNPDTEISRRNNAPTNGPQNFYNRPFHGPALLYSQNGVNAISTSIPNEYIRHLETELESVTKQLSRFEREKEAGTTSDDASEFPCYMITHTQVPQHRQKRTVKAKVSQEVNTITLNRAGKPALFSHMNDKPVQALVDTVIAEKRAKQSTDKTIAPPVVKAYTITADEITLPSTVGSLAILQTAQVMPQSRQDCLLGVNFIDKLESLSLNTTDSRDSFTHHPITHVQEEVASITLPAPGYILKWSEIIAPAEVKGKIEHTAVISEPKDSFMSKHQISCSETRCRIKDNEIPIRLLNLSSESAMFHAGTTVETITVANIVDPNTLPKPPRITYDLYTMVQLGKGITRENPSITSPQAATLKSLLGTCRHSFANDDYDPGRTFIVQYTIPLPQTTSIKQRPYRTPPDPENPVKAFLQPSNMKEVCQFIGLASYYRRFIQEFEKIAILLNDLPKRVRKFLCL